MKSKNKLRKTKIGSEKYTRPSWDDYFMKVMEAIAKWATCDRGRAGTVIAKENITQEKSLNRC